MSAKFGGGGNPCSICKKTCYAAEQIQFEKIIYHGECFRCQTCDLKLQGPGKAAMYKHVESEDGVDVQHNDLFCQACFAKGGYAQKQRESSRTWGKGASTGTASTASSKFGGGGSKCIVCNLTAYTAEQLIYEKQIYHAKCFKCQGQVESKDANGEIVTSECGTEMTASKCGGKFDEKVFCTKCWNTGGYSNKQKEARSTGTTTTNALASKFGGGGSTCQECSKTVYDAEKLTYEKMIYHPACFKCYGLESDGERCQVVMANTSKAGGEWESHVYCTKCWTAGGFKAKQTKVSSTKAPSAVADARFSKFGGGGEKCSVCDKTVYAAEKLSFEKKIFHVKCFVCPNEGCGKKMQAKDAEARKFKDDAGNEQVEVYCRKCFVALGYNKP